METVIIKAEKRTDSGKKSVMALRRSGKMPCIMYGAGLSEKLALNTMDFFHALSGVGGRRVILQVELNGEEKRSTILKELQHHPLTDKLLHADLLEINLEKTMTGKLPLHYKGDPVGVKIKGGVLKLHLRELNVECLPAQLPISVEVDVSKLDVGDMLTVGDIHLPDEVSVKDQADEKAVSVAMPKAAPKDKEDEPGAAEGEEAAGKTTDDKADGDGKKPGK
ncbi:MAG: hypothetical protein IEMM0002_0419 [bacterium]|nr:MAG: hypothetical protein IEMM0002_0419 [bacterium]